jgi:hypothetical protein
MFSIYFYISIHLFLDQIEEAHYLRLVSILHDLLLCDTKTPERREDLQSHTINLLTNMPPSSFEELLSPITEIGKPDNPDHEFNEMNMEVIDVMLQFLSKRLDSVSNLFTIYLFLFLFEIFNFLFNFLLILM